MKNKIGMEFMKMTQYKHMAPTDRNLGLPAPAFELSVQEDAKLFDLEAVDNLQLPNKDLLELITKRRSIRRYSQEFLSKEELSYLLWCTQGVKEVLTYESKTGKRQTSLRTVPSAGSCHPFESYLVINRVQGFVPGLYRYISSKHKLCLIDDNPKIIDEVAEACLNQKLITESAISFIWVADSYRSEWSYGERGFRYFLIDAGHICQNLYLAASSIDAGVCAIGAFDEEKLNKALKLEKEEIFAVYLASVGKPLKEGE